MTKTQQSELPGLLADYKRAQDLCGSLIRSRRNQDVSPDDQLLRESLNDYQRFMHRSGSVLSCHPALLRQLAANWYAKTAVGRDAAALLLAGQAPRGCWLQQQFIPEYDPNKSLMWSYLANSGTVALACNLRRGWVAVAAQKAIAMLDADTGQLLRTLQGDRDHLTCLSWSPKDDWILAGSADGNLHLWDASSGERRLRTAELRNGVTTVAWSPGGDRVIAGRSDSTVELRHLCDKQWPVSMTLRAGTAAVTSVSWSPGGGLIAAGHEDGCVAVWQLATGQLQWTARAQREAVTSLSWAPCDDRIASAGADGVVRIRAAVDGKLLQTLTGHRWRLRSVCWSPDAEHVAAGGHDQTILIWSANDGKLLKTVGKHSGTIRSVLWLGGGEQTTEGRGGRQQRLSERIVSCGDDRRVCSWSLPDSSKAQACAVHAGPVRCLSWAPGADQLVSGSDDKTVVIWSGRDGTVDRKMSEHKSWVTAVCWSPLGDLIVSGDSDGILRIGSARDEAVLIHEHGAAILSVCWSLNGQQILYCGADGAVGMLSSRAGKWLARDLCERERGVLSVDWSPAGLCAVFSRRRSSPYPLDIRGYPIYIRRLHQEQCDPQILPGHDGVVRSVVFSPIGDRIASCGHDQTVRIWSATDGRELKCLSIHQGKVLCLAWCRAGELLVSGGDDCSIRVSNASSGEALAIFPADSAVECVTTTYDAEGHLQIAAGLSSGRILWLVLCGNKRQMPADS